MAGPDAACRRAVAAGERGATRIADRVVAKIASQAAREALAELPAGRACRRTPRSSCATDRARRRASSLELGYPSDIGGQCARCVVMSPSG